MCFWPFLRMCKNVMRANRTFSDGWNESLALALSEWKTKNQVSWAWNGWEQTLYMRANQFFHVLPQSLFPTISISWYLAFCFLLWKGKNQAFIAPIPESSIGSHYIFTHPQKWSKKSFFGTFNPVSLEN